MRNFEVIVDPQGGIQIDAVNFHGPDCEQATRFLEEALGAVTNKRKKPEHYQCRAAKNQQRIGG